MLRNLHPDPEFWQSLKVRYLKPVADITTTTTNVAKAEPCAMNFWTFAVPVLLASAGSHGIGLLAKRLYNGEHKSVQEAALLTTKFGAFWLIAGFAWIAMCKRNGAKT